MVIFICTWFYLFATFAVCPFFWELLDSQILNTPLYFFSSFLFCFFFNYGIIRWKENYNNNKDLFIKFISFLLKPFSIFFTFFFCEIKKFFNFIKDFKYRKFFVTSFLLFRSKLKKMFLLWRPLFKKSSYFGYFRTNKSKWWK